MPSAPGYEVVVIGAGVAGLAVARALARAGPGVAVLDQGPGLPARGSSRGDARIRVLAAYPDAEYLELGLRAAAGWRDLEAECGGPLLHAAGALSFGEGLAAMAAELRRFDVPHEELTGEELTARVPSVAPPARGPVVFQPDGAVIAADRALAALLASARRVGVELREGERVLAVEEQGEHVRVGTERGGLIAGRVVIAAGPWAAALIPWPDLSARLRPSLQTVSYFAWEGPPPPAVIEYGAPDPYAAWSPRYGLKAADHQPGPDADPDGEGTVDPARVEATREWVARRFPGVDARPVRTETCIYTNTPDERFVFERHGAIGVVSACNGQGFQFASVVGELAAEMMAA